MSQVLIVTGASRGIGLAVAGFFLDAGWNVEGASRGESPLRRDGYSHSQVDLLDAAAVKSWAATLRERHGDVAALVCATGHMPAGALAVSTRSEDLVASLQSNLVTAFNACREIAPLMIPRRFGRIVCVSSIMTALHARGTVTYSTAKAGVNEMIRVFAREMAPLGITCNVVAPGFVATDSSAKLGDAIADSVIAQQALPRAITLSEVCHTIQFLVSPESGAVTGQIVYLGVVA